MLAMVAVATTACQNEPEVGNTPDGGTREITVKESLANFNRATDVAFEEGDQIGLHIITNEVTSTTPSTPTLVANSWA